MRLNKTDVRKELAHFVLGNWGCGGARACQTTDCHNYGYRGCIINHENSPSLCSPTTYTQLQHISLYFNNPFSPVLSYGFNPLKASTATRRGKEKTDKSIQ